MKGITLPEFEQLQQNANAYYWAHCRNQESYEQLGREVSQWRVVELVEIKEEERRERLRPLKLGDFMPSVHVFNRGSYAEYPARTVSFGKDKRDQPYFIRCSKCGRHHCSDAWLPFGYVSFWQRMRMSGDGSPEKPYLFWCLDQQNCGTSATDDAGTMRRAINYSCTYARRDVDL